MKNKLGISLLVISFIPWVATFLFQPITNFLYNFFEGHSAQLLNVFLIPISLYFPAIIIIPLSYFAFRSKNEKKIFPILALIIVILHYLFLELFAAKVT